MGWSCPPGAACNLREAGLWPELTALSKKRAGKSCSVFFLTFGCASHWPLGARERGHLGSAPRDPGQGREGGNGCGGGESCQSSTVELTIKIRLGLGTEESTGSVNDAAGYLFLWASLQVPQSRCLLSSFNPLPKKPNKLSITLATWVQHSFDFNTVPGI